MTDYTELVKALRGLANGIWKNSEYTWFGGEEKVFADAAAAIEELQAEVMRLKAVIDELREAQTYIDHYGDKWMTSAKDVPTSAYNHGYMDGKNEAEQALEPKRCDLVEVVRCKDCVYYHKAHVKLDDGTELDYDSDVVKEYQQKRKESGDPFWEMVCADLGMNVGGRCERDNNQGYAEDKAVFRSETDFCSKARAKMEVQE